MPTRWTGCGLRDDFCLRWKMEVVHCPELVRQRGGDEARGAMEIGARSKEDDGTRRQFLKKANDGLNLVVTSGRDGSFNSYHELP